MWFENTAAIVVCNPAQIKSTSCKRAKVYLEVFSKHFISSALDFFMKTKCKF